MKTHSFLLSLALALVLGFTGTGNAAEDNHGKQMYLRYCGSCHGAKGSGDGPVSRDLKVKMPDLATLAKKNRGVYPLDDVMAPIDGRRLVRGHGDRDMPVWGENFRSAAEGKKYPELTTLLKAKVIAEYVATLQRK